MKSKQRLGGEPTYEELRDRVRKLEAEAARPVRFNVAAKGGVSAHLPGQRYPVTLYYDDWQALLANTEALKKFLEENKNRLKMKE